MRHAGTEYGYLLSGELVLTLGFDEHRLGPGDAVSFESTTPHRYRNDGDRAGRRRLVRHRAWLSCAGDPRQARTTDDLRQEQRHAVDASDRDVEWRRFSRPA